MPLSFSEEDCPPSRRLLLSFRVFLRVSLSRPLCSSTIAAAMASRRIRVYRLTRVIELIERQLFDFTATHVRVFLSLVELQGEPTIRCNNSRVTVILWRISRSITAETRVLQCKLREQRDIFERSDGPLTSGFNYSFWLQRQIYFPSFALKCRETERRDQRGFVHRSCLRSRLKGFNPHSLILPLPPPALFIS